MGDQIKQTFQKLKAFWTALSPKIKKLFIFGFLGLLVLAVALTVFLNVKAGKYTVLYPSMEGMTQAEIQETMATVQEMGYEARLNGEGRIEVQTENYDDIVARLALENVNKSTIGYELYDKASSLTATDADKRQYDLQEKQDRIQKIIRRFGGVENVAVMLNLPLENVKIWEKTEPKGSASVTLTLDDDVKYTPKQVSAIKRVVATSVPGIKPEDVMVADARTGLELKGLEDQDPDSMDAMTQRIEFETKLEEKLEEKARQVLSVVFAPEDIRVAATVRIDYDKVKTEEMNYSAAQGSTNNSGVLQHADQSSASGTSGPAQGVPGEDPNTDALPQYVNETTDGGGYSESSSSFDYLVPYVMNQIERDPAKFTDATISVTLRATPDQLPSDVLDSLIQSVSMATHIDTSNISVANYALEEPPLPPGELTGLDKAIEWFKDPVHVMMVGAAVLLFLLLIIVILVLLGKARKHKQQEEVLEAATADVIELQEEDDTEFNLQQELEERKRQLRESSAKTADEAIADEVRDFAKNNPEITANLLRAWMKEEID